LKPRLMSQKAYATLKGVSPQYVNKLVSQGKIQRVGRLIDAHQANAVIKAFARPAAAKPAKPLPRKKTTARNAPPRKAAGSRKAASASFNLTAARFQTEQYKGLKARLDFEVQSGKLLPRAEVLDLERRKNTNIRTMLRRLPRSLAPLLARADGPAEIETLLLAEIDLVLERLARNPLGMHDDAPPAVAEAELPAVLPPAAPAKEIAEAS